MQHSHRKNKLETLYSKSCQLETERTVEEEVAPDQLADAQAGLLRRPPTGGLLPHPLYRHASGSATGPTPADCWILPRLPRRRGRAGGELVGEGEGVRRRGGLGGLEAWWRSRRRVRARAAAVAAATRRDRRRRRQNERPRLHRAGVGGMRGGRRRCRCRSGTGMCV